MVSFPYRPGATIRSGTPTGWRGYISKDPTGSAVVIRNGNHYRAYNAATRQPIRLRRDNERLQRELAKTQAALDVVGKAHALLELLSESADTDKRS